MRVLLFSMLLLIFNGTKAQEFKTDFSYRYIFANQWERAIQTYNFSRPFLGDKQPLFFNGLNVSESCIFKSPSKNFKHGINLSYSYFKSSAENENLNNNLILHFLNLGYIIHYEKNKKRNGFYADIIISAVSSGLFRNVNGESFKYDEKTSKAFGIGGDLSVKAGYYLKNKIYLSPFVLIGYTPYIYSPNSEVVINQTKALVGKNWTGILAIQMGLTFYIKQLKNK